MGKFKSKHRIKFKLRYLVIIVILFLFYQLLMLISSNFRIATTNETFLVDLLSDTNYHLSYRDKNIFVSIFNKLIDVNDPIEILKNNYENKINIINDIKLYPYANDKTVYIYNTHDLENYSDDNIYSASSLLEENLKKDIHVIKETLKTSELLKKENKKNEDSFKTSRVYLEEANKNNKIDLYIDLHRSDSNYQDTTIETKDKKLAKIEFIVELVGDYSEVNNEIANKINAKLNEEYPNISTISTRKTSNINQDLTGNMIFINIGGHENNLEEVENTILILSNVIKEILYEEI